MFCLDFPTAKARLYEVTGYHSLQRIDLDFDDFLVDFSPSFAGARGAERSRIFAGLGLSESVEIVNFLVDFFSQLCWGPGGGALAIFRWLLFV